MPLQQIPLQQILLQQMQHMQQMQQMWQASMHSGIIERASGRGIWQRQAKRYDKSSIRDVRDKRQPAGKERDVTCERCSLCRPSHARQLLALTKPGIVGHAGGVSTSA
jgi:hypothetical protein